MVVLRIFLSVILTLFASAVLAYISMATMIGPWIAPTLVLFSAFILRLVFSKQKNEDRNKDIAIIQTVGSVGGIVATAVGFTFPTLYFLDPDLFKRLLSSPLMFCGLIAFTCMAAGGLGIWLARSFANKLMYKENFSFPVSELIKETIIASSCNKKIKQLAAGFASSGAICLLRDGFSLGRFFKIKNVLPSKDYFLFRGVLGKAFHITIVPMFWAIGFIIGPAIAMPLLVGMLSKYAVAIPLVHHAKVLPFRLFPVMDVRTFISAFSAGLVVSEVLFGMLKYPKIIWNSVKFYSGFKVIDRVPFLKRLFKRKDESIEEVITNEEVVSKPKELRKKIEAVLVFGAAILFFSVLKFPLLSQVLILGLTVIATYQISFLGAKIGLVQFGRFATFVMIPTILLFKLSAFQITMLCVFVSVAGAASSDLLFDYKIGQYFDIDFKRIQRNQWLGLAITALGLGFVLWLLFTNLQLGTAELFGQRGMNRALLIQTPNFNLIVVGLGLLYGFLLKRFKINPTMVFGGLLMPNGLTIGLVLGALGSMLSKDTREQLPFFSGVFSGESVWLIVSILTKMF
jgi:uncharacterized oligopeptide transporter (OPT) family protein